MPNLKDKVVIVTGAGSGIGRATALRFAGEGAKLVLVDRREDRLVETAGAIEAAGGEAVVAAADVSRREEVESAVRGAVERYGRVDVLVNNAGFALGATIERTADDDFRDLWETNVLGTLYGMQAVLPLMRERRSGHIINVSSAAGRIAFPGIGAYSATKAAVVALTEALRAEIGGTGIEASVVLPVGTETEFFAAARKVDGVPVGPHGPVQTAEHVARRIVDCAKQPTAEVLPYRWLRLGSMLHGLFPNLLTIIGRRTYRRIKHDTGPTAEQPQEVQHG